MFRTLRSRLILSHLLPLLVVVPLTGIALISLLEQVILLTNLASEFSTRSSDNAARAGTGPARRPPAAGGATAAPSSGGARSTR